jgi:hypothetical protein
MRKSSATLRSMPALGAVNRLDDNSEYNKLAVDERALWHRCVSLAC